MKIEKLTDAQVAKFPEYVEKYTKIGLSTESIDLDDAISIVHDLQENVLHRKKTPVVLMESPLSAWLCVCLLSKNQVRDKVCDQVGAQVSAQVGAQVSAQVSDQVDDQVRDKVRYKVGDQVRDKVSDQLWAQVGAQVSDQVRDQIMAQVRYKVSDQIMAQVRDNVSAQVGDQVSAQVDDQVRDKVRYKVSDQLDDQVSAQVGTQLWNQVSDQVRDQVWDQVWDQVGAQVRNQVRNQVGDQVSAQIRDKVSDQLDDQIHDQVSDQLWAQVGAQVSAKIHDQVGAQIWDQIRAQVRDKVSAQISAQVSAQVDDQVRDKVSDQLWAQVGAQVSDQVWDQIRAQVRDKVSAQVSDQVSASVYHFIWPYLDGNFYSSFFAFFAFMNEVVGIKIDSKLNKRFEIYKRTLNLSLIYPLENICVLSDKPKEINMNDGVLHCEGGPAVLYRDGFCVYSLWGVRVPRWLTETPLEKLKLKDILKIKNADIKAVGLKRFGAERIVNEGYGRVIEDKMIESGYKLIDLSSLFDSFDYAPHLYMTNPSVPGLVHCEGVPPEIKTIEQALKWREDRVNEDFEKVVHT